VNIRRVGCLIVATLLVGCGYVRADTIVISSGHVVGYWDGSRAGWELIGQDTRLHGENYGGAAAFYSGTVVDLSRVIGIYQDPSKHFTELVRGTTFDRVVLQGQFSFSAVPFIAPTAPDLSYRTFQTPFTMAGHVNGFSDTDPRFTGSPAFSVDVTGSGIASLGAMRAISQNDGRTAWIINSGGLNFSFSAPDPDPPSSTPEPGTLMLLGSGLAVAAVVRARRRK
jgi:hypothetical protein